MTPASKYMRKAKKRGGDYDPVMSRFLPSVHLGSISESFDAALEKVRGGRGGLVLGLVWFGWGLGAWGHACVSGADDQRVRSSCL